MNRPLRKPMLSTHLDDDEASIIVYMNNGQDFEVRASLQHTQHDGSPMEQPTVNIEFIYPDGEVSLRENLGIIRDKVVDA